MIQIIRSSLVPQRVISTDLLLTVDDFLMHSVHFGGDLVISRTAM